MNEYKWNLNDIFESREEFYTLCDEVKKECKEILKYKGNLSKSSDNIYNCYKDLEILEEKLLKIDAYATLKYHQDMQDTKNVNIYKDAQNLMNEIFSSVSFVTPEITNIDDNVLLKYLDENNNLKKYERLIKEIIKDKKHILSEREEYILSKFSTVFNSFDNIYTMLCDVNFKFGEVITNDGEKLELTHATYSKFLQDSDVSIRKQAFENMYSKYGEYIDTIAENYLSNVRKSVTLADLRNYSSSLESALDSDDSNIKVYENLVNTVNENLHINHRYMKLKAKMLNMEKLHMYDVYVNNVVSDRENISYDRACETVKEVLKPMGEEYVNTIDIAIKNGWIDVYETKNKYSGGYSMGVYGVHPYILLNYTDDIESESTLIHELGHTMHSYLSSKSQNLFNSEYTIMVAEVASTVNEILLAEYLIEKEEDKLKKAYLINSQIDRVRATLVRQTMFAEFEKIIHEKINEDISLSAEEVSKIYFELNKKYFGEYVISDEYIKYEWARIPHFYREFYVYKYATGISCAIMIANKILNKEEGFVEKYLEMLSLGGSKDSLELLKMVGVDLETKIPVENAFKYLEEKLNELESLID